MDCTPEIYAYIRTLTFTFGIFTQLRDAKLATAEVELTGTSEKAMVGSPFELTCSSTGFQPITGFEMFLNNESAISTISTCLVLLEPNSSIYDYYCPSKTQLKLIIKTVTKDNDGDIWRCKIYFSHHHASKTYTISVYDDQKETTVGTTEMSKRAENREHTTEITTSTEATFAITDNTRRQDDTAAISLVVGIGSACFVALVSVVVIVLLKRKKCHKDKKPLDQTTTKSIYANVGDVIKAAKQGHASSEERVYLNECTEVAVYTALNPGTRNDTAAYDVLQIHSVTAEHMRASPCERVDLNECTEASVYTALNPVTQDYTAMYSVLQTHSV